MVKARVLEILTALAAGADPFTGEELPAQAGQPWSAEEEEKLERGHGKGRSIREIATELQRTTGAVHSRLLRLGLIEVP